MPSLHQQQRALFAALEIAMAAAAAAVGGQAYLVTAGGAVSHAEEVDQDLVAASPASPSTKRTWLLKLENTDRLDGAEGVG